MLSEVLVVALDAVPRSLTFMIAASAVRAPP